MNIKRLLYTLLVTKDLECESSIKNRSFGYLILHSSWMLCQNFMTFGCYCAWCDSSGRPSWNFSRTHEKKNRNFHSKGSNGQCCVLSCTIIHQLVDQRYYQIFLIKYGILTINHSRYSPYLAPSDFYLFGKFIWPWKERVMQTFKRFKGRRLPSWK